MTREEAKSILIREQEEDLFMRTEYRNKIHEALNMAIKALEQEQYYKDLANSYEKTINKLTKAISKQEPKTDVLAKIRAEIEQTYEQEKEIDKKWAAGLKYSLNIIDKALKEQSE